LTVFVKRENVGTMERERLHMVDTDEPGITPEQSRAGRALLDWSQDELAAKAGLSGGSVRHFEKGRQPLTPKNQQALRQALEVAGITFIEQNGEGPGCRLTKRIKDRAAKPKAKAKAKARGK
jgi:transcriptional regulator with XRE-family HTH domain